MQGKKSMLIFLATLEMLMNCVDNLCNSKDNDLFLSTQYPNMISRLKARKQQVVTQDLSWLWNLKFDLDL